MLKITKPSAHYSRPSATNPSSSIEFMLDNICKNESTARLTILDSTIKISKTSFHSNSGRNSIKIKRTNPRIIDFELVTPTQMIHLTLAIEINLCQPTSEITNSQLGFLRYVH